MGEGRNPWGRGGEGPQGDGRSLRGRGGVRRASRARGKGVSWRRSEQPSAAAPAPGSATAEEARGVLPPARPLQGARPGPGGWKQTESVRDAAGPAGLPGVAGLGDGSADGGRGVSGAAGGPKRKHVGRESATAARGTLNIRKKAGPGPRSGASRVSFDVEGRRARSRRERTTMVARAGTHPAAPPRASRDPLHQDLLGRVQSPGTVPP